MEASKRLSPGLSGGLEDTYTDFDGWLAKRNWVQRHRPYQRNQEINPRRPTTLADFQESFVYGVHRKSLGPQFPTRDLISLTRFGRFGEDGASLDLVLLRLINDNGRRRLLVVNKL